MHRGNCFAFRPALQAVPFRGVGRGDRGTRRGGAGLRCLRAWPSRTPRVDVECERCCLPYEVSTRQRRRIDKG
jgi:hypothetical protein